MPHPRLATIDSKDAKNAKKCSPTESMRTPSAARKERDLGRRGLVDRVRRLLARRLSAVPNGSVMRVDVVPASGKAVLHAAAAKPCVSRPEVSTDPIAKEILQITDELRQRLDRHTLSRKVFPHLAVLERELKRSGYRSLSTLPPELLDAALGQLVFITGRIPGELCTLRAKVLEAIFARAPAAGDLGGQMARSMFDAPDEVQVSDATESAFFHAEEEWAASRISARPHRSDPFRRRTFAMPFSPTSGDYTEATP